MKIQYWKDAVMTGRRIRVIVQRSWGKLVAFAVGFGAILGVYQQLRDRVPPEEPQPNEPKLGIVYLEPISGKRADPRKDIPIETCAALKLGDELRLDPDTADNVYGYYLWIPADAQYAALFEKAHPDLRYEGQRIQWHATHAPAESILLLTSRKRLSSGDRERLLNGIRAINVPLTVPSEYQVVWATGKYSVEKTLGKGPLPLVGTNFELPWPGRVVELLSGIPDLQYVGRTICIHQ